MDPVNGIVVGDQNTSLSRPMEHGQVQTADFFIDGNLRAAYQHLKDMFDPPKTSKSGPIKPITKEEVEREKQKPQEDFVKSLDPTTSV